MTKKCAITDRDCREAECGLYNQETGTCSYGTTATAQNTRVEPPAPIQSHHKIENSKTKRAR